jgi:dolichol-phosphate mannosyltransferase
MTDRILVFIPCYNCAGQIGRVLAQFQGPVAALVDEILVLDNGSSDGTAEAAIAHAAIANVGRVTIARNRENYNLGGSHKAAYHDAGQRGFTHVVTLHGDDQGDISDLLPVLQSGEHRRFDACMGARFARGARLNGYSAFRIWGNRLFNLVFSVAARRRVFDLGSGLNILANSAFADPALRRLPDDLFFNPYLLLDMIDRGNGISFFPISWREDDQISNVRMISQAAKTLGAAFDFMLRRRHFQNTDYRSAIRDSYEFVTLARFSGGIRDSAG